MAEQKQNKFLFCGLGGGLDVVNATLLYYAFKNDANQTENHDAVIQLGSARPAPQCSMLNHESFAECGTFVSHETSIKTKGRYIEPMLSGILNEKILFLSRETVDGGGADVEKLSQAIEHVCDDLGFNNVFFIDGGGDSLILQPSDATSGSETTDPFRGGDSEMLAAIYAANPKKPCKIYQAIISVGLDIDMDGFQNNVNMLKNLGGYCGRVNLRTGEKEDFLLDHIFKFSPGFLEKFFELAENILVITTDHKKVKTRMMSHTATVTYHALKGNFGVQRTWVSWEPKRDDGTRGVEVKPEHCWIYFFDAKKVEQLKIDLNKKN